MVLPETVQFSICFTLPVIYLTLTLPATQPTELSAHPGDLTEFFFGLWDFFIYFFIGLQRVGCITCYIVRYTLAFLPERTRVLNVTCALKRLVSMQSFRKFQGQL